MAAATMAQTGSPQTQDRMNHMLRSAPATDYVTCDLQLSNLWCHLKIQQLCCIRLSNSYKSVVRVQSTANPLQSGEGAQHKGEGGWKPAQGSSLISLQDTL